MFYSVANDHGVKSSLIYNRAKKLFLDHRDIFNPFWITENFTDPENPILVDLTGNKLGARYPRQAAKSWYLNTKQLIKIYKGDPRNLFQSAPDAQILLKNIRAFRGYGAKIGGMLLRAIVGLGFSEVSGLEKVLVPVDIHDSRISFFTEILKPVEKVPPNDKMNYNAYVSKVQQILLESCNELKIKWLNTDRALWLIGSRGCVKRRCIECPLKDICTIGKAVRVNNCQLL